MGIRSLSRKMKRDNVYALLNAQHKTHMDSQTSLIMTMYCVTGIAINNVYGWNRGLIKIYNEMDRLLKEFNKHGLDPDQVAAQLYKQTGIEVKM